MKKFSNVLIIIGLILMFSAAGNDDMTASHYPLVDLLTLLYVGVTSILIGVLLKVIRNVY